ncbi:hypothetical protein GBAR_LOCUS29577, partial [Geodia barretti]
DYDCPYSGEQIVQRARELQRTPYNARTSNCEHFVMEARTGQRSSVQVRKGVFHAVFGGLGCAAAGAATGILAGGAFWFILGAIVGGIVGAVGELQLELQVELLWGSGLPREIEHLERFVIMRGGNRGTRGTCPFQKLIP